MMYFPMLGLAEKSLPLFLAGVGRQENQESIDRQSGFPFHQLIIVTHGAGILEYGENMLSLSQGTCWFIQQDSAHRYYATDEPFTTRWVCFGGLGTEGLFRYFSLSPVLSFSPRRFSLLRSQHQTLLEAASQNEEAAFLSALLYRFLTDAFAESAASGENTLDNVRTWIYEHYREEVSLDDLALQAGMDKYALCRAFRHDYGTTPVAFLLSVRLQKAKELLVGRKDLTVRDIGFLAGFHDPVYFGRMFRRQEGMTPLSFRKQFG